MRSYREGNGNRWLSTGAVLILALVMAALALASQGLSVASADARPVPAPAPAAASGATQFRLAQWADLRQQWQFGDLNRGNSAYHEGEAVPFMLRIDNARPGNTYVLSVRYDCAKDGVSAYDFLTDYARDRGTAPALAPEGPGDVSPESTAVILDDVSIPFDDGENGRQFQAWGAVFLFAPVGPNPPSLCEASQGQKAEKSYELHVQAQEETVFVLWGGHLATSLDWGDGKGAASISGAPFHMKLDVPGAGVGERDRSIQLVLPPIVIAPPPQPPAPPPGPPPSQQPPPPQPLSQQPPPVAQSVSQPPAGPQALPATGGEPGARGPAATAMMATLAGLALAVGGTMAVPQLRRRAAERLSAAAPVLFRRGSRSDWEVK